MPRRTRVELEAENLVLYRQLESLRDQLDGFLEGGSFEETDYEPANGSNDLEEVTSATT